MFREKTQEACGYTFTLNNRTKKQPLIKTEMREKETSESEACFHAETSIKLYTK